MTVSLSNPQSVAESLMLAMVASSDAPLLLLDGELDVIALSKSFGSVFEVEIANAPGHSIFELGSGEWDTPKLRSLLGVTLSGHAAIETYEMDLFGHGKVRRLLVKAQKLEYADADLPRLLVTVSDVTNARIAERLKDELLRERAVLLEEIQHRVANSLQIIASMLMQSARSVQSEETKIHLRDAHNRVMSIAAVQRQLASSGKLDVELRPYFTLLCQSLGASMIQDHNKQSIHVTGDASTVGADTSVSLGLIVTELVINALKHAFPGGRTGKIMIDYQSNGPDWTLAVNDDGIGMHSKTTVATPGLGTSIIEAIAKQLHARVQVTDAGPGTAVSIVHSSLEGPTARAI